MHKPNFLFVIGGRRLVVQNFVDDFQFDSLGSQATLPVNHPALERVAQTFVLPPVDVVVGPAQLGLSRGPLLHSYVGLNQGLFALQLHDAVLQAALPLGGLDKPICDERSESREDWI